MYQVVVIEKIFGKITENTYGFPTEEQRDMFKELCEDDDVIIITREQVAV
ncbi:hypothetical protein HUB98_06125 [Paenibacillus barcinonensis]|uniref:Uncharacterized protein n=1 Tax=Paenibacillus barcinonensis TaxID=198119 RepID=A0A2V4WTA1_PAEBA|nr:hypothetical protein [Paenibacillus barcinonensis]PYE51589.1 hypothetical protein DFQ00_102384 [Paenibacillus barcinonensis]QKS55957.1 hypothetical protein HUB98_06125 [Paenibacillus barcinonensis]